MQQVRLMMFSLNMVDYSTSFLSLSTSDFCLRFLLDKLGGPLWDILILWVLLWWWVAYSILVSAQGPMVFGLLVFGFWGLEFGARAWQYYRSELYKEDEKTNIWLSRIKGPGRRFFCRSSPHYPWIYLAFLLLSLSFLEQLKQPCLAVNIFILNHNYCSILTRVYVQWAGMKMAMI